MNPEMEHCQNQLKQKGYKLTEQRRNIIRIFLASDKHLMNAAQIYERVKEQNIKMNCSTVYRNLETLMETGLIKKVSMQDGTSSYEYNRHQHHHHLICMECGDAEIIHYCPFSEMNQYIQEKTNFQPVEHRFEIYGYCSKCRNKRKRDEANDHHGN